jgi:hypothetical protein
MSIAEYIHASDDVPKSDDDSIPDTEYSYPRHSDWQKMLEKHDAYGSSARQANDLPQCSVTPLVLYPTYPPGHFFIPCSVESVCMSETESERIRVANYLEESNDDSIPDTEYSYPRHGEWQKMLEKHGARRSTARQENDLPHCGFTPLGLYSIYHPEHFFIPCSVRFVCMPETKSERDRDLDNYSAPAPPIKITLAQYLPYREAKLKVIVALPDYNSRLEIKTFSNLRVPWDTDLTQFLCRNLQVSAQQLSNSYYIISNGRSVTFPCTLMASDCHCCKLVLVSRARILDKKIENSAIVGDAVLTAAKRFGNYLGLQLCIAS